MGDDGKQKYKEKRKKAKVKQDAELKNIKSSGIRAMSARTFGDSARPPGAYTSQTIGTPPPSATTRKVAGMTVGSEQAPMVEKDFGEDPDKRPANMKYGGGVPGMKNGGKPRGCGIAVRGVKPTKMV